MAPIPQPLTRLRSSGVLCTLYPRCWSSPSFFFTAAATISSASHSSGQERVERGPRWLLFLPGAVTFGLGTWQIFRRQDKIKTLEYRQKRLQMEPIKINDLSSLDKNLDLLEFRRVVCRGTLDEERSIYVGPRSRSISGVTENGYYVITPLMPIANDIDSVQLPVLVNRGWVPRSWKDKSIEDPQARKRPSSLEPIHVKTSEESKWWWFWSKKLKEVEDQVSVNTPLEVIGVVRGSEQPSIFVPPNEQNSNQWFYVDVPAISAAVGLPDNTVYIEKINENVDPSNPYPVPRDVNSLICTSVMPQDHLNYTLTWYSLSAAVTYMAFRRLQPRKSRR